MAMAVPHKKKTLTKMPQTAEKCVYLAQYLKKHFTNCVVQGNVLAVQEENKKKQEENTDQDAPNSAKDEFKIQCVYTFKSVYTFNVQVRVPSLVHLEHSMLQLLVSFRIYTVIAMRLLHALHAN